MTEQIYMNVHTGSTGTRDEWNYEDEGGHVVNAVARGEVVPVAFDDGQWQATEAKNYCTQNDGNCQTCALSSYGRDCVGHPIN